MSLEITGDLSIESISMSVDLETPNQPSLSANFGILDVVNYNDIFNKPKINGVELIGDKSSQELKISGSNIGYEVIE